LRRSLSRTTMGSSLPVTTPLTRASFTTSSPSVYPSPTGPQPIMDASMPKVLIVEDDEVIAQGMARHLGAAGFDPVSVGNGTQGLARLRYEKPDVCVLDLMLPGVDGWKLIETARNEIGRASGRERGWSSR